MLSFNQMCNMINGEPYHDIPPPVNYKLADYATSPVNGAGGGYELKPLSDEDMARYAAEDVVDHYTTMHNGKNPLTIDMKPMSDGDFKRFMGQTW